MALERTVTELLQGRSLKDLDVFTPPTFDDEEVAEHANLETHFIDSSGLISWDMFKQDADYPFVDWSFSGTTEEEFATLMAIFKAEDKEVYIADYEHRAFTPAVSSSRDVGHIPGGRPVAGEQQHGRSSAGHHSVPAGQRVG